MQAVHTVPKENEHIAWRAAKGFSRCFKYFAFILDNIYKKQSYSLLNETLFNTRGMTVGSARNKFTDLRGPGREQIIFFMSLVKDSFITVKFSQ